MQFHHQVRGKYLLVAASGRLDASWSDHFSATFREYIRQGSHQILLDANDMTYLSSAGIRALVQVIKSVKLVNGSFQIVKANDFVQQTLTMTGFGSWLIPEFPDDMPDGTENVTRAEYDCYETFPLAGQSSFMFSLPAKWVPWKAVSNGTIVKMRLSKQEFALGIGAPEQAGYDTSSLMGEFLAVGGNVVYQPPRDGENPDFLMAEKDYIPEMHCIQALHCTGDMSHLIRFAPHDEKMYFGVGEIAERTFVETKSEMTAFVILAEIDGLVGSAMIKSPGFLQEEREIVFPEIKEWLSFCGERVHARQQALIFGVAAKNQGDKKPVLLPASSMYKGLYLHAHAAVFPYQPLESGIISIKDTTSKFFNGPPPLALFHLVEDQRPATGLGESAFIRGACWCAPIKNHQEDLLWE
jgi:anti-anti-sigma factor